MVDQPKDVQSYLNLTLSFRGSERQPPSVLSLALTFSSIMKSKSEGGQHDPALSTETRLKLIVDELHNTPGFLSRWALDESKQKAVLNLLQGTSEKTRAYIAQHLDFHKWKECSLTADLLRSARWLIGAAPKTTKAQLKSTLTVSAEAQERFIQNHIATFCHATRRVKPSARSKHRPSQQEWDRLVDYSCVMLKVKQEVVEAFGADSDQTSSILDALDEAFMSRTGSRLPSFMKLWI